MKKDKPTEGLLPIGVVAQSFGVSENSIRRMEAAGLLIPAYISQKSGYRYYDNENISRIATILSLKSFGFVYDDMRGHFQHPGDYSELYEKLVEKRKAITLQIEKMRRFLKNTNYYQCEIIDYMETYCLSKKAYMRPTRGSISDFTREFVYEAIKGKYPINYTRAVLILTDCMDYREYKRDSEQELTFCIPLREKVEGENILYLPGTRAVAYTWSYPAEDYSSLIPMIDNIFSMQSIKQSGALRAAYDVGGYMGKDISPDETIMHIQVPFK